MGVLAPGLIHQLQIGIELEPGLGERPDLRGRLRRGTPLPGARMAVPDHPLQALQQTSVQIRIVAVALGGCILQAVKIDLRVDRGVFPGFLGAQVVNTHDRGSGTQNDSAENWKSGKPVSRRRENGCFTVVYVTEHTARTCTKRDRN